MKHRLLSLLAGLSLFGCNTSTLEISGGSEVEQLAEAEYLLRGRVQEAFGADARLQRLFTNGSQLTLGVALAPTPPESDAIAPLAIATYDVAQDQLAVIAKEADFREARPLPTGEVALVSRNGELRIVGAAGEAKVIAQNVRGDVQPLGEGGRLALTLRGESEEDGETAVAITDSEGDVSIVADGEGVDDRPAVSPDGTTIVFVSGRTGIASLWRTDTSGADPVQLTNVGIEPGVARDADPPGFVPPPVVADRITWASNDLIRYDAGDGEQWEVDVRTGAGRRVGGAR